MTERDDTYVWELVDFARWCLGAAPEGAPMPPVLVDFEDIRPHPSDSRWDEDERDAIIPRGI